MKMVDISDWPLSIKYPTAVFKFPGPKFSFNLMMGLKAFS